MARFDTIQTSFLSGELSPRLLGRVDLDGYRDGAAKVENFIVRPHGGVDRRGGFKFVAEVKDSTKTTILHGFAYRNEFFYILEFGHNYIRFFRNQAAIMNGESELEVVTTYGQTEVADLRFTQDESQLYITHKDHVPAILDRHDHTDWNIHEYAEGGVLTFDTITDQGDHTNGLYEGVALTGGGGSGVKADITIAGGAITDMHVHTSGSGYAVDETLTIPTATIGGTPPVRCDVALLSIENMPSEWGAGNYPSLVWFYEQRLFFAATPDQPNGIWSTKSADYHDFDIGTGLANESIQLVVKEATKFLWATTGEVIQLGSHNGQFNLVSTKDGDPLTPANTRPVRTTRYGSSFMQPLQVDSHTVFVQKGLRKFRRMEYKLANDRYTAKDISILSEHITASGVAKIDYADEPDSIIWALRTDGQLVGLTYEPEYEVFSWHRHIVGGTDVVIKSIAVGDGVSVDQDELWSVISRTIGESTVQYIEFLTDGLSPEGDQEDAFFIDSGATKTGSGFTTMDGLDHLEGETVSILADGAVQAPKVVAGGDILLDVAADKAHAGLPFTSTLDLLPIEGGNPIGTSQGKIKRIITMALRLYRSLGFKYGSVDDGLDTYIFGPTSEMDAAPELFTGDTEPVAYPGGHERQPTPRIETSEPLPLNILAIMYEATTK